MIFFCVRSVSVYVYDIMFTTHTQTHITERMLFMNGVAVYGMNDAKKLQPNRFAACRNYRRAGWSGLSGAETFLVHTSGKRSLLFKQVARRIFRRRTHTHTFDDQMNMFGKFSRYPFFFFNGLPLIIFGRYVANNAQPIHYHQFCGSDRLCSNRRASAFPRPKI